MRGVGWAIVVIRRRTRSNDSNACPFCWGRFSLCCYMGADYGVTMIRNFFLSLFFRLPWYAQIVLWVLIEGS
jgi:hypothetical protein